MELAAAVGAVGGVASVVALVLMIIDRKKLVVTRPGQRLVRRRSGERVVVEKQVFEEEVTVEQVGGYSVETVYDALRGKISFIEEYTRDAKVVRYDWQVDTTDDHKRNYQ